MGALESSRPAQLNSRSRGGEPIRAGRLSIDPESQRSSATPWISPERPPSDSGLRAAAQTVQPRRAKLLTSARPRPRFAPVTRTEGICSLPGDRSMRRHRNIDRWRTGEFQLLADHLVIGAIGLQIDIR